MPRPTDQAQLLALSQKNYRKLLEFIDSLAPGRREEDRDLNGRDRNVRDVLCHLHGWHRMMERWHRDAAAGKTPAVPAEGYTWRTIPALNRELWAASQATSLAEARRNLDQSHEAMTALIAGHTDQELFGLGVYAWTKTTTLGAYFVSATSSHYDWALKTLKPLAKAP